MKVHNRENNSESQSNLDKNKKHFSNQCKKVLQLLLDGKRLTTINAPTYGILSLPRRILDIKLNGIRVDEKWITYGEREIKEWFIAPKTDSEKRDLQKFLNEYQEEKQTASNTLKQLNLL